MRWLILTLLAFGASGCNLLVSFDPEGQPCDTTAINQAAQCLANYRCEAGKCVRSDGGN